MKKIILLLAVLSFSVFAEPSFDQIETMISNKQYSSAAQGLEVIISNHPNSAKAYYAMAQAQAGIGNLEKARHALDKATGLDPQLKFASSSNVDKLREAITPQTDKIASVNESHWFRNTLVILLAIVLALWAWLKFRKDDEDMARGDPNGTPVTPFTPPQPPTEQAKAMAKAQQATSPYPYTPSYTDARASSTATPQVVNNHYGSSSDGLVTGMILGSMLSGSHDHYVEREVIRETPASISGLTSSSWDSGSSSTSSSWDDSSSSSSSSWDSSSSSDSSWDSSSSSDSSGSDW